MINTDRVQKIVNEFRDDVNNDLGMADILLLLTNCICDLNERLIRIEDELDAQISEEENQINHQIADMTDEERYAVIMSLAGSERDEGAQS